MFIHVLNNCKCHILYTCRRNREYVVPLVSRIEAADHVEVNTELLSLSIRSPKVQTCRSVVAGVQYGIVVNFEKSSFLLENLQ
jgi:hypothetical protein